MQVQAIFSPVFRYTHRLARLPETKGVQKGMKKYIDADRLSRQISDTRLNLPYDSKDFFTRDFMLLNFQQTIDLESAADVEEVKHGKWENMTDVDSAYLNTYRCSACGTTFWIDEIPEDANYNYCPNCGAKMDKE